MKRISLIVSVMFIITTLVCLSSAYAFYQPEEEKALNQEKSDSVGEADERSEETQAEYADDRILIKLKDNVAFSLTKESSQNRYILVTDVPQLNTLNQQYASDVKLVFASLMQEDPATGKVTILSSKEGAEEIKRRFPQRAARIPRDVGEIPELNRWFVVHLVDNVRVEAALAAYQANPSIEYAQPDYPYEANFIPNDPYYSSSGSWGQSYDDLWGLKPNKLNCAPAWDISLGNNVVVAVIDTGVDYNHQDIANNMWNDGSGHHGYDFANNDNYPMDDNGHGTHCAGAIAAVGNNAQGIIGVAPSAKIMAVKGLFYNGLGWNSDLVECLYYATYHGADVLSNSWGPGGYVISNPIAEEAIDYAYDLGCIVVFSAGNWWDNVAYYSPANYSKTVAVAATDTTDHKAWFSNYGTLIDVSAPGVGILSLRANGTDFYGGGTHIVGNYYYWSDGTSMACPHVAGLAALLVAQHPSWQNNRIIGQLVGTADPIDAINPNYAGGLGVGRLNTYRALTETQTFKRLAYIEYEIDDSSGNGNGYLESGETANFTVTLKNYSGAETGFQAHLQTTDPYVSITGNSTVLNLDYWGYCDVSFVIEASPNCPPSHETDLQLTVTNNFGQVVFSQTLPIFLNFFLSGWPKELEGTSDISQVVLADVNAGGLDEVIVAADEVYVFNGQGNLLPGWPQNRVGGPTTHLTTTPSIGDIDGDGDMEIVLSEQRLANLSINSSIMAWHSNGSIVTGFPLQVGSTQDAHRQIVLADLDNDGKDEIILPSNVWQGSYYNMNIHVLKYTPTQIIDTLESFDYERHLSTSVGNMDSDDQLEFLMLSYKSGIPHRVLLFDYQPGALTHTLFTNINSANSTISGAMALGDVNNDGGIEVFVGVDNCIHGYDNNGNPLAGWGWPGWSKLGRNPILGDINGDGYLEIIVSQFDSIIVYQCNGVILWEAPLGWVYGTNAAALGDIDSDGMTDVLMISAAHEISAWNGNGSGAVILGFPIQITPPFLNITGSGTLALGDINGDALVDIITGPLCMEDRHIYVFARDAVYNPDTMAWPMAGHDQWHTSNFHIPSIAIVYPQEGQTVYTLTPTITWNTQGISQNENLRFVISHSTTVDLDVIIPNAGSYTVPAGELSPNISYTLELSRQTNPNVTDTVHFSTAPQSITITYPQEGQTISTLTPTITWNTSMIGPNENLRLVISQQAIYPKMSLKSNYQRFFSQLLNFWDISSAYAADAGSTKMTISGVVLDVVIPNTGSYTVPAGELSPNISYTLELSRQTNPNVNDTVHFSTAPQSITITYPQEGQTISTLTPTITWNTQIIAQNENLRLVISHSTTVDLDVIIPNSGSYTVPAGELSPNISYTLELSRQTNPNVTDTVHFSTAAQSITITWPQEGMVYPGVYPTICWETESIYPSENLRLVIYTPNITQGISSLKSDYKRFLSSIFNFFDAEPAYAEPIPPVIKQSTWIQVLNVVVPNTGLHAVLLPSPHTKYRLELSKEDDPSIKDVVNFWTQ